MTYKVLHPKGMIQTSAKTLQIKGRVGVSWIEVLDGECTVALETEPSMILVDELSTLWIFNEIKWQDLFPNTKEEVLWSVGNTS